MLFPGTIELWTLGDVLGPLLRAGVSGVLELTVTMEERGPSTACIFGAGRLPP